MHRFSVSLLCALALAGCAGANTSLSTVQVSGAEEAFPADYQGRALHYLAGQDIAGVQISYPRTVVGETAFSPKRWYVCLDGLAPPVPPSTRIKPVLDLAMDLARRDQTPAAYHVILILRASGSTTAITGFDAPLCADGRYEALAAG